VISTSKPLVREDLQVRVLCAPLGDDAMNARNRGYYRQERRKHINRKKRIIHQLNDYWYYKYEGCLNKGKIHCSCPLCRCKTNNKHRVVYWQKRSKMWKHSDQQKIDAMNAETRDYEQNGLDLIGL